MPGVNKIPLPRTPSVTAHFVDREMMRLPEDAKTLRAVAPGVQLPDPPASLDWDQGDKIDLPMLANDKVGNCYYVACCKCHNIWRGAQGEAVHWDTNAVVQAYLRLSGGDNGLYTSQMMGEWKERGLAGTQRKMLAYARIDPNDETTMRLAMHLYGPLVFTMAMPSRWVRDSRPGCVYDGRAGDRPNPGYGHAVILTSAGGGKYDLETWGYRPSAQLHQSGMRVCDPEAIAVWSLDWFDPKTGKAPNGHHYKVLAEWWRAMGGPEVPPSPFPDPPPGPNPPPDPDPDPVPDPLEPQRHEVHLGGSVDVRLTNLDDLAKRMTAASVSGWLDTLIQILAMLRDLLEQFKQAPPTGKAP